MSEKVKVSREVAEAIDYTLSLQGYKNDKGKLLISHAKGGWCTDLPVGALNGFPILDLAKVLLNGYEIKQTPEEIVFEQYKRKRELMKISNELKPVHEAYADGMKFALDTLNIKIDGINSR